MLHTFIKSEGAYPEAEMIRSEDGNLYGTVSSWGPSHSGAVFALDHSGNETVIHVFHTSDGLFPESTLVRDAAGNLYGTTFNGGGLPCVGGIGGCGVVFKIAH